MDEAKWLEFSELQGATCLEKDEASVKRFEKWLETGNAEDAWS